MSERTVSERTATVTMPATPQPAAPFRAWHHRSFRLLWTGQTVSLFGTQITLLALPLAAVSLLGASALQVGILGALEFLPVAGFTLLAGALADRMPRRRLLIASNLVRAAALSAVPLLTIADRLSVEALYVVAFATGVGTAVFDVAYQAYLPTLVPRAALVAANSRLQLSQSVAQTGGQGLGGVLVGVLTAPFAIVVDACSYLFSTAMIARIRESETPPTQQRTSLWSDIRQGVVLSREIPLLRVVMSQAAWFNLWWAVVLVVLPLLALRTLAMSAALLGMVIASGSVGALLGSLAAPRLGQTLGTHRALGAGMVIASAPLLLLAVPADTRASAVALLVAAHLVSGLGVTVFNVHSVATRQRIVPLELMGRVTATYRFAVFVAIPLGSLGGGLIAENLGPRTALTIAAVALTLGSIAFWRALQRVRSTSHATADTTGGPT